MEQKHHTVPHPAGRPAARGGVLLPSAAAITASTAAIVAFALVTLDDQPASTLTHRGFQLATVALFFATAILRLARWRLTTDPYSALLAAAMVVLGVLSLPVEGVVDELGVHALGTVVCLLLALRAMTVADQGTPTRWLRTVVAATAAALVGLGVLAWLSTVAPTRLSGTVLEHVAVDLGLACAWLVLGLAASQRDRLQPWAGRVAPIYASLGVVEVLRTLEQVRPGSWSLPAAALLASVAMITAQCAYVDLVESARHTSLVLHRTDGLLADLSVDRTGDLCTGEDAVDFSVTEVATAVAERRRTSTQEVRVRGDLGYAHARPGDVAAAVEKLLANAHTYAPQSPVTLYVVTIGSRVEVSVADRGPGLSAATADRAFESGGADRGAGLGLHLARALMTRNGGDLELRNRIGGATFVITLPAAVDEGDPRPLTPYWDLSAHTV